MTQGKPTWWNRCAASGRQIECAFCATCGSRLWHESTDSSEIVSIKAGSLDEPVDLSTAIHIWTSRKLPGVVIPDEAKQYQMEP